MSNEKYGLVLAGGGGKGSYQIGAWKAMLELGIEFEVIAGVSIGSINGALIAANDFDKAVEFWNSIAIKEGLKIIDELPDKENLFSTKNWAPLFMDFVKNKGIDASPAKNFLSEFIDEDAIRNSKIPIGIVTVNRSQGIVPIEIFSDEIPQGELIDYLLASSNAIGASGIGPEGERFIDGGLHDNLPIALLRKNGYNRIIAVDISNMKGLSHDLAIDNAQIILIKPYDLEELGPAFDFSRENIENRMLYGYYDTKKAFSLLLGNVYYFQPEVFRDLVKTYGADEVLQLEKFAFDLKVNRLKIYEKQDFLREIKLAYSKKLIEIEVKQREKGEKELEKLYSNIVKRIAKLKVVQDFSLAVKIIDELKLDEEVTV